MIMKKCIVWLLVFAFLNLTFEVSIAFASGARAPKDPYGPPVKDQIEDMENDSNNAVLIGSLIILGAVVVGYIIVKAVQSKKTSSSAKKIDTPKQSSINSMAYSDDERTKLLPYAYDEIVTPSGNLAIYRW